MALTVRKKDYQFDLQIPNHYWRGPFGTHFLNALHLLFPPAEELFVKTFNKVFKDLADADLTETAKAFSQQEMQHSLQHKKFCELLQKQGYEIALVESFAETIKSTLAKRSSLKLQIAIVAGIEHFTALMGNIVLSDEQIFEGMHPQVRELLEWHAAEEIEHKSAAFDVLQAFDDSYLLRAQGMIIGALLVYTAIPSVALYLCSQEEDLFSVNFLKEFLYDLSFIFFGRHMFLLRTLKQFAKYFDPDFHPDQVDDYHLAQAIFQKHESRADQRNVFDV